MKNLLSFFESNNKIFFEDLCKVINDVLLELKIKLKNNIEINKDGSAQENQQLLWKNLIDLFHNTDYSKENKIRISEDSNKIFVYPEDSRKSLFSYIIFNFYKDKRNDIKIKLNEIGFIKYFKDNPTTEILLTTLSKNSTKIEFGQRKKYFTSILINHDLKNQLSLINDTNKNNIKIENYLDIHLLLKRIPEIYQDNQEKFISYFFKSHNLTQEDKDILLIQSDLTIDRLELLKLDLTNKNKAKDKNVLAAH